MELQFRLITTAIIAYVIGSIPIGWIFARYKGINILQRGSGKIGFTNVQRTLGLSYAIPVLILDIFKGIIVVLFSRFLLGEIVPGMRELIVTIAALTGHNWSVIIWLADKQLRGGTGVAVALGSILIISPINATVAITATLIITVATRYVSLGVLIGMTIVVGLFLRDSLQGRLQQGYIAYILLIYAFLIWRHKRNILNLINGVERRLGDSM